jgi:hypothetical protein
MAKDFYLTRLRLEDVIFLIQYLGLGEHYSIEEGGKPDGVGPRSAGSWSALAKEHPEFFRLTPCNSVTLSLRYYRRQPGANPAPLGEDQVQQLIQNAIALQERQAKRSEVWKVWGTFIAAMVAALAGIAQLLLGRR